MATTKQNTSGILLVVGMQNDKLTAMTWGGEVASDERRGSIPKTSDRRTELVAEVNRCIQIAMEAGWKVKYVLDVHHPMHSSFKGHGGTLQSHCVLSTWGCNPFSGLKFGLPGTDLLIRGLDRDGDSADAFWTTVPSSPTRLVATKSHFLVLCGASPDGCIENTAATALARGMEVCVPEKAAWLLPARNCMPLGVQSLKDIAVRGTDQFWMGSC